LVVLETIDVKQVRQRSYLFSVAAPAILGSGPVKDIIGSFKQKMHKLVSKKPANAGFSYKLTVTQKLIFS
jgi:hypothetical protein